MTRKCWTCKKEKPLEDYYRSKNEKYGRHGRCIECVKSRILSDPAKETKNLYNREKGRARRTGFTPEDFSKKLKEQDNKCAICGIDKPMSVNWHADHCHKTKTKRGILCQKCNMGIGLFNDDIETMEKAIIYLNKYKNSEVAS